MTQDYGVKYDQSISSGWDKKETALKQTHIFKDAFKTEHKVTIESPGVKSLGDGLKIIKLIWHSVVSTNITKQKIQNQKIEFAEEKYKPESGQLIKKREEIRNNCSKLITNDSKINLKDRLHDAKKLLTDTELLDQQFTALDKSYRVFTGQHKVPFEHKNGSKIIKELSIDVFITRLEKLEQMSKEEPSLETIEKIVQYKSDSISKSPERIRITLENACDSVIEEMTIKLLKNLISQADELSVEDVIIKEKEILDGYKGDKTSPTIKKTLEDLSVAKVTSFKKTIIKIEKESEVLDKNSDILLEDVKSKLDDLETIITNKSKELSVDFKVYMSAITAIRILVAMKTGKETAHFASGKLNALDLKNKQGDKIKFDPKKLGEDPLDYLHTLEHLLPEAMDSLPSIPINENDTLDEDTQKLNEELEDINRQIQVAMNNRSLIETASPKKLEDLQNEINNLPQKSQDRLLKQEQLKLLNEVLLKRDTFKNERNEALHNLEKHIKKENLSEKHLISSVQNMIQEKVQQNKRDVTLETLFQKYNEIELKGIGADVDLKKIDDDIKNLQRKFSEKSLELKKTESTIKMRKKEEDERYDLRYKLKEFSISIKSEFEKTQANIKDIMETHIERTKKTKELKEYKEKHKDLQNKV